MDMYNGSARIMRSHRLIDDVFRSEREIFSVVKGRYSDIEGVWIAPVRAAVMITLDIIIPPYILI